MPEREIIVGQDGLHLLVVLLDRLVLLLQPLVHTQGHLIDILILYLISQSI